MLTKSALKSIEEELERMIARRSRLGEFDPNANDVLYMLKVLHVIVEHLRSAPRKR